MAYEVKLPDLGEGIDEGEITSILVSVGDVIAKDQTICEMETQKAVFEVPSPVQGKVLVVHLAVGQTLRVGALLLDVEVDAATAVVGGAAQETGSAPAATEEPAPQAPAPRPPETPPASIAPPDEPEREEDSHTADDGAQRPAGPATRLIARELGVDLQRVTGTGPRGRIQPEDVKKFAASQPAVALAATPPEVKAPPGQPAPDSFGPTSREPFRSIRKKTAEHLQAAWSQIPHVTQFDTADVTELMDIRGRYKHFAVQRGGKLTPTVFIVKAVTQVLKEFPNFNAMLDTERDELVYKQYFNIGIAVDTDRGLLVPVLKNADTKSILELAVELDQLARVARSGKSPITDFQGGSFTITNLGGIGGTAFTPIINAPEVAILGISQSRLEPVVKDGDIVPRLMMPFCVSYDHRVIDGADGARFTRRLAEVLEDPVGFLLDG